MQELITTFHIDWKLMLAQLINFAVVALVLWRFALKPLMKTMHERSETIEKSLREAADIERKVKETDQEVSQRLTEARAHALAIMNESKKEGEQRRREIIAKTKAEVESMIQFAKGEIQNERESAVAEAQREVAHLVVRGVEKVLGRVVDKKLDKKITREHMHHL